MTSRTESKPLDLSRLCCRCDSDVVSVKNENWCDVCWDVRIKPPRRLVEQYDDLQKHDERLSELNFEMAERLDVLERMKEQFETLEAAAMRLCNVHRWSYGGPETLVALADRIAAKGPSS